MNGLRQWDTKPSASAQPSRQGRPHNFRVDPHGLKRDLARLGITLIQIADRAGLGGKAPGRCCYVCNVLSGRQRSPRVVAATQDLIAARQRETVP
jgi:hypothetical protein